MSKDKVKSQKKLHHERLVLKFRIAEAVTNSTLNSARVIGASTPFTSSWFLIDEQESRFAHGFDYNSTGFKSWFGIDAFVALVTNDKAFWV